MSSISPHYQELFIKDINDDTLRARILGKVIEKGENFIIIDDGTGIIKVSINESLTTMRINTDLGNDIIVFGKIVKIDDSYNMFADIIIDASSLNLKQYRKMISLSKEVLR